MIATPFTRVVPPSESGGRLKVRGAACDDYEIARVVVSGREAKPLRPNFAEWEVELDAGIPEIVAHAEDAAGNVEKTPHRLRLESPAGKVAALP